MVGVKRFHSSAILRFSSGVFVALLVFSLLTIPVRADTFTVTTDTDPNCTDKQCDFQSALAAAQGNGQGDTITITSGTYSITNTLTYSYNVSETYPIRILGDGPASTIIDGGDSVQVLSITSPADVVVRGLSFKNGDSGASGDGGGLFVSSNGGVTVENCVFEGNTAGDFDGGGAKISAGPGGSYINSTVFRANSALSGGGLQVVNARDPIVLENSLFDQNQGVMEGGGADVATVLSGEVTVSDNTFNGNSVGDQGRGGGLHLMFVEGSTVQDNHFIGNSIGTSCLGDVGCGGGGAHLEPGGGPVLVIANTFTDNVSPPLATGGGLKVFDIFATTELTAVNNVFLNNSGGAVDYETGQIGFPLNGNLRFTNNTAVLNSGVGVNIEINENSQVVNIYNNIIHSNDSDLVVFDRPTAGTATVNVFNNDMAVFSVVSAIGSTANKSLGGNITDDPLLVDPAAGDIHLGTGSPAIDAGLDGAPGVTVVSADFEGQPRIQGAAIDMGADETGLAGSPNIEIAGPIVFPETCEGSVNIQTVTIANSGAADLEIGQIYADSDFRVVTTTDTCSSQSVAAAGGTCTLEIEFTPTSSGNITGSLTVPSNDPVDDPATVSLEGTGSSTLTPPDLIAPSDGAIFRTSASNLELTVLFQWSASQSCTGSTITYDFYLKRQERGAWTELEPSQGEQISSSTSTISVWVTFSNDRYTDPELANAVASVRPPGGWFRTGIGPGLLTVSLLLTAILAVPGNPRRHLAVLLLFTVTAAMVYAACGSSPPGRGGGAMQWTVDGVSDSGIRQSEVRDVTVIFDP